MPCRLPACKLQARLLKPPSRRDVPRETGHLAGLDFMWAVAFDARKPGVPEAARATLVQLYTALNEPLLASSSEVHQAFIR